MLADLPEERPPPAVGNEDGRRIAFLLAFTLAPQMESLSCAWQLTVGMFMDGRPAASRSYAGIAKLLLPHRQSRSI
jgi:hypothetical protein